MCVSEEGGREGGGGRRGADTELKTKTPHVNVGKNGYVTILRQSHRVYVKSEVLHIGSPPSKLDHPYITVYIGSKPSFPPLILDHPVNPAEEHWILRSGHGILVVRLEMGTPLVNIQKAIEHGHFMVDLSL